MFARIAEDAALHAVLEMLDRLLARRADANALPCGEAVRLDDERVLRALDVGPGVAEHVEDLEVGRRDVVAAHERLGEDLGALETRRLLGRTEALDPGAFEPVDEPHAERPLGADDGEVDLLREREGQERLDLLALEVDALRDLGAARVAGSGVELGETRRLRQLPAERVLAAAVPDDEDFHGETLSRKDPRGSTVGRSLT